VRAPREILETTRAECRIEKITLAQSHRRAAGAPYSIFKERS